MSGAIQDSRKDLTTYNCRLIFLLSQCYQRPTTQALERIGGECRVQHHVSQNSERGLKVTRRRNEIYLSVFSTYVRGDIRAEQLQGIGELIAALCRSPFSQH